MSAIKVKINIAGRLYPLSINAEEEESVRNAGKEINKMIEEFEKQYAVNDKQDAIAMAALQIAAKNNQLKQTGTGNDLIINEKVIQLTELIERELNN